MAPLTPIPDFADRNVTRQRRAFDQFAAVERNIATWPGWAALCSSLSTTSHAVTATATGMSAWKLCLRRRVLDLLNGSLPSTGAVLRASVLYTGGTRSRMEDVVDPRPVSSRPTTGSPSVVQPPTTKLGASPACLPGVGDWPQPLTVLRALGKGEAMLSAQLNPESMRSVLLSLGPVSRVLCRGGVAWLLYRRARASAYLYMPVKGCLASALTVNSTASAAWICSGVALPMSMTCTQGSSGDDMQRHVRKQRLALRCTYRDTHSSTANCDLPCSRREQSALGAFELFVDKPPAQARFAGAWSSCHEDRDLLNLLSHIVLT